MLLTGLLLVAFAADAPAKSPTPPFSALTSPTESARYALTHGCVAAARAGGRLTDVPNGYLRDNGRGVHRMTGAGRIVVTEKSGPGCYMQVGLGDAEALRAMALDVLAAQGPVRTIFDSGPGSRDSGGAFRQETHCVRIGDRDFAAVISTSSNRKRPPLQLSLFPNNDPDCGHPPTTKP